MGTCVPHHWWSDGHRGEPGCRPQHAAYLSVRASMAIAPTWACMKCHYFGAAIIACPFFTIVRCTVYDCPSCTLFLLFIGLFQPHILQFCKKFSWQNGAVASSSDMKNDPMLRIFSIWPLLIEVMEPHWSVWAVWV